MAWTRTSKPASGNKFYNTKGAGGYSTCISGSPTQRGLNVLNNCVGLACGAFNETYCENKKLSDSNFEMKEHFALNCNGEDFIKRAKSWYSGSLNVIEPNNPAYNDAPPLGGIIVWGNYWYYRKQDKCKSCGATGYFANTSVKEGVKSTRPGYPNKCPVCGHSTKYFCKACKSEKTSSTSPSECRSCGKETKTSTVYWYTSGIKSVNHVAYIQEVISKDKIVIAQSGYGYGPWVWDIRTITRKSSNPIDWYCADAKKGRCLGYIINPAITPYVDQPTYPVTDSPSQVDTKVGVTIHNQFYDAMIYHDGKWVKATPQVYSSGIWKKSIQK